MHLILPSMKYKDSYLDALEEYLQLDADDRLDVLVLNPKSLEKDFQTYITQLHEESEGKHLPQGYVPQTTYWLVDGDEFIGRVSIRHTLTPELLRIGGHIGYDIRPSERGRGYGTKILELVLPKAKELGIPKALVTCNDTNLGSKKIIEANGGVFENSESQGNGLPRKLRYWITLKLQSI
ncbi:MAG: GNAT family N-acetyltransferase [Candidatus Levyibacteriota bacterium]